MTRTQEVLNKTAFLSSTPLGGVFYKVSDHISLHKMGKGVIDLGLKKCS